MTRKSKIEQEYSLSVDGLSAYVVEGCISPHIPSKAVIATGFEYFISNESREIFLVYSLEDVINTKIKILNLSRDQSCDICTTEIQKPISEVYSSSENMDQFLSLNKEFQTLPDHTRTHTFEICEDCQSSVINDLNYGLAEEYKVAHKI